jgi:hypothetical protein
MIGQILSNNNEKCYRNFSQKILPSKQTQRGFLWRWQLGRHMRNRLSPTAVPDGHARNGEQIIEPWKGKWLLQIHMVDEEGDFVAAADWGGRGVRCRCHRLRSRMQIGEGRVGQAQ